MSEASPFAVTRYLEVRETMSKYMDRSYQGTREDYHRDINSSGTLYIGNLDCTTREEQIYILFSQCGEVKRVIMGLDSRDCTPCGFCFVEYYSREDSKAAKRYFSEYRLDGKSLHVDLDPGFVEGRQFGRGRTGRQLREDYMGEKKRRRRGE